MQERKKFTFPGIQKNADQDNKILFNLFGKNYFKFIMPNCSKSL